MAVKLFVLGLPGTGKSTMAREIKEYIGKLGLGISRINDYVFLKQMFYDDAKREQFRPAKHGGFDIIDLTVFDTALQRLEKVTKQYILPTIPEGIILIEFARNDYQKAFQQFNQDFLQDAYFLYIDAEIETCKWRIRDRVNNPAFEDDYNVSDYIFEKYYHKDDGRDLPDFLEMEHRIGKQRVSIIDNNCSLEAASKEIAPFIDAIIDSEYAYKSILAQPEKLLVGIR
jgi:adenylate kinase family enzyme